LIYLLPLILNKRNLSYLGPFVTIRRFKTLLAIAELGSFSEAAKAEYLTPSAVSQQMRALEDELRLSLFDRTKRPPELNPTGYALVPKARELVKVYESLRPSLTEQLNTVQNLTVGTVASSMSGLMPKALKGLQESHEHLHIRLYPALSDDLYAQVDRGFLDAAVLTQPVAVYDHLVWRPFTEEPYVVLANRDVELNDARDILQSFPFIRFARKAWVGRSIDQWLIEQGIKVNECMELDTLEAVTAMVRNNLGVSIVPNPCVGIGEHESLKTIPLGPDVPKRVLGVLYRRDTSLQPLIELLWQELFDIVKDAGVTRALDA
jgi:DNA-binding transcriptional LysR family regulator